jgi:hypothetical protein
MLKNTGINLTNIMKGGTPKNLERTALNKLKILSFTHHIDSLQISALPIKFYRFTLQIRAIPKPVFSYW